MTEAIEQRIREQAADLERRWSTDPRWKGVERTYTAEDVIRLQGSFHVEHSIARAGAERLWELVHDTEYVNALGALTGGQAVEMVKAGLQAIYLSGWQVAADANVAGPDLPRPVALSRQLRAAGRAPHQQRDAARRPDRLGLGEGTSTRWMAPILADAEAGFGGALNAFELMKGMIEAGAAGVHFEDQLASEKKCGHLGGKVLVPTDQFIRTLTAARLAADVADVPTLVVARTDALAATLLTTDIDERDRQFTNGERTHEGFYQVRNGLDVAIARGQAYAPYADMIWCETSTPDLDEARAFAEGIHAVAPDKLLAYNCSPSFNWKQHLDDATIARFQKELGAMGYKFQFITLAGFHALNASMFELARGYADEGMTAYVRLQEQEFAMEAEGYTATRHQAEVGTGYFDQVSTVISGGRASTLALEGSTEEQQFQD